ncbi:uncharacterized protein FTJAE_10265 [Fusarium tjaetaba]|uniref:Uncharacterized protein n=1 Tax=Fusarium tjaetaba TaxID=1567544 RepID=A0A8H5R0J7_9HYPO|nr:uncharacterized protein FTJAE_10265 [Fusarium tjaetaba]KAF5624672.1 hypothetical protein FTJAE_10265 [Fusarium tjaetaba]
MMSSPKLLLTLVATFLFFTSISAGNCKPKPSLSESTTTTTYLTTDTTNLVTATTDATTLPTTTTGTCTLEPRLDPQPNYHLQFTIGVETCYDLDRSNFYKVGGGASNGFNPWVLTTDGGEYFTVGDDGHVSYRRGYVIAQEPGTDNIGGISDSDTARAGWTRLTCKVFTTSNTPFAYMTCVGDGPENSIFQICQLSPNGPLSILLSASVSPGCSEAYLFGADS